MRYKVLDLKWSPLPSLDMARKLESIFQAWEGTPYREGQQTPGSCGGVDCVRFVFAVFDAMEGKKREVKTLTSFGSHHNPVAAMGVAWSIRRLYKPLTVVKDLNVQPGDIVCSGPSREKPSHVAIVGTRPGVLWQSAGPRVHRSGYGMHEVLIGVFRKGDREEVW